MDVYKLEFRTKENLFSKIENEIKKIHNYGQLKFFILK